MRSFLNDVRVELATAADAPKLLKLMKAYYRFDGLSFRAKAIASGLSLLLNDSGVGGAWLILNRGKAVGYFILTFGFDLEFGGRQATLTDLYVEARYRRRGIGRMALARAEEFCRSHGVQAIELQVNSTNASALDFYRRAGFQAHERIPMSKCFEARTA